MLESKLDIENEKIFSLEETVTDLKETKKEREGEDTAIIRCLCDEVTKLTSDRKLLETEMEMIILIQYGKTYVSQYGMKEIASTMTLEALQISMKPKHRGRNCSVIMIIRMKPLITDIVPCQL